jgi:predicted nucleotidyltransferase
MPAEGVLPAPHARFLERALERLPRDPRIVGIAVGGSYLTGTIDEFSDLDLVIAVEPAAHAKLLGETPTIAAGIAPLLTAFGGEHVGEPRLLICLYGPPLLHVDLKFVRLDDLAVRVEDPVVLWERGGRMTAALATGAASYPVRQLQWVEDRIWTWVHYVAGKVGRGELFEALEALAAIRSLALGPLALLRAGARPSGVRKLEAAAPVAAVEMAATVAAYDARSCTAALHAAVEMYRDLRAGLATPTLTANPAAESAVMAYVREIEARLSVG